jgi:hypothetical protein
MTARAAAPIGRLTTKTRRQESWSTMSPPASGPGDARDGPHAADEAHVAGALARRDEVAEDAHRGHQQAAGAETLHDARDGELGHRAGQRAERRAGEEEGDRPEQDGLAPADVAELAVERRRDGLGQQVRGHDPREIVDAAELAGDRRQRRGDDRLVERGEQDAEAEGDEHGERRTGGGVVGAGHVVLLPVVRQKRLDV